jgi:hypothetical protein
MAIFKIFQIRCVALIRKLNEILVCSNTISVFDYCLLDEMRLKIKEVTGFELDTTGSGEQVGLIFINAFSWREI